MGPEWWQAGEDRERPVGKCQGRAQKRRPPRQTGLVSPSAPPHDVLRPAVRPAGHSRLILSGRARHHYGLSGPRREQRADAEHSGDHPAWSGGAAAEPVTGAGEQADGDEGQASQHQAGRLGDNRCSLDGRFESG